MKTSLYPLRLEPVYKDYIWGGNRLASIYNRSETPAICAESWEIADRPEGMSIVSNGPLKGMSLRQLLADSHREICGISSDKEQFPLLIKLIDAKQRLSLQVHPNNSNAEIYGGQPKTEMWYVLEAEPGATIMAGFDPGTNEASFRKALAEKDLQALVSSIAVKAGQVVYIPGGRIHAIGSGVLILEIQQNSNTTYRAYDWDRIGPDGNPRDLHIEQAIQAIDWQDKESAIIEPKLMAEDNGNYLWTLVESPYFRVQKFELQTNSEVKGNGDSFHALFVESGEIIISGDFAPETCIAGSSILIPAAIREYEIMPKENSEVIITSTA